MLTTRPVWPRLLSLGLPFPIVVPHRKFTTSDPPFREGDVIVARPLEDPSHAGYLSRPLAHSNVIHTPGGPLRHDDILGKRTQHILTNNLGKQYRLSSASLDDYIVLTRRIVTPIYPAHANLLASLLDVHVSAAQYAQPPNKLHILEAGTGHGALTLFLAKAIHAANPPQPPIKPSILPPTARSKPKRANEPPPLEEMDDSSLDSWKLQRSAILHTLDISSKHSNHARSIVRNFRQGLYYGTVDFHIGDVPDFIDTHKHALGGSGPFLSHVILDMPSPEQRLSVVTPHMRADAKLLVFNPSITQITECVRVIDHLQLPLEMESVIELPQGSTGGRQWDVRIASIRKPSSLIEPLDSSSKVKNWIRSWFIPATPALPPPTHYVCRPLVGGRVSVGGFVGVWIKRRG